MSEFQLPETDDDIVGQLQADYDKAFNRGTEDEVNSAKTRLIWALVHSSRSKHVERGLQLAQTTLDHQGADREIDYLASVALYKLSRYVDARKRLRLLLERHPGMHQAQSLKASVDDAIVKEGLVGVGIAAGVVGVGLAILFGSKR